MAFEVKVPAVGESVQEGEIYKWHKASGDFVKRDDVLLELETDKATVEIVSEASGVIEILKKQGDTVTVGQVIAKIDTDAKGSTADAGRPAAVKEPPQAQAQEKQATTPAPLSPAVNRMVAEHGLDPNTIPATGKGGRITKTDVVDFMAKGPPASPSPPTFIPAVTPPPLTQMRTATGQRGERREKLSRLRLTIAERLVHAQHTAAMLTTFNEIDMTNVMAMRKKYKDPFQEAHGVGLGFMSFFVKAAVMALHKFPEINGWIDGNEIVYHDYYDVGVAVSTERGLMVPVIRNVDTLSFAEIESAIVGYAKKSRDNKITLDDLSGGTFTVSNGGTFGSLLSTPILNPPQSGIMGMHKIQERPMVIDGQIVIRPMMYVALSYDHRIVDGRGAVGFLVAVKQMVEDPARLLLGV